MNWQALLFVPANSDRLLQSAIRHRPDAVILDLEDAVAPGDKAAARKGIGAAQTRLAEAGIGCVVRVNAPLAMMVEDIAALDRDRLSALLLPKVETPRPIENAAELAGPEIALIALIETPLAFDRLPKIAAAPRLSGLMLGSEDLSAAMGVDPDGGVLQWPAARIALAAAARGLLAIGFPGSIGNFRDLGRYRRQLEEGRNLGMNAVAAIHPAQLPVIREALMPTAQEIAWARSVIEAARAGQAVSAVEGIMVDAPVLARAHRLLARSAEHD